MFSVLLRFIFSGVGLKWILYLGHFLILAGIKWASSQGYLSAEAATDLMLGFGITANATPLPPAPKVIKNLGKSAGSLFSIFLVACVLSVALVLCGCSSLRDRFKVPEKVEEAGKTIPKKQWLPMPAEKQGGFVTLSGERITAPTDLGTCTSTSCPPLNAPPPTPVKIKAKTYRPEIVRKREEWSSGTIAVKGTFTTSTAALKWRDWITTGTSANDLWATSQSQLWRIE